MENFKERRREKRIQIEETLTVTLLGPPGGPPVPCVTCDLSGSGLLMVSPRPFPCGSLVKLEGDARLLLGEVIRSEFMGGGYEIAVKVQEVLEYAGIAGMDRFIMKR